MSEAERFNAVDLYISTDITKARFYHKKRIIRVPVNAIYSRCKKQNRPRQKRNIYEREQKRFHFGLQQSGTPIARALSGGRGGEGSNVELYMPNSINFRGGE